MQAFDSASPKFIVSPSVAPPTRNMHMFNCRVRETGTGQKCLLPGGDGHSRGALPIMLWDRDVFGYTPSHIRDGQSSWRAERGGAHRKWPRCEEWDGEIRAVNWGKEIAARFSDLR